MKTITVIFIIACLVNVAKAQDAQKLTIENLDYNQQDIDVVSIATKNNQKLSEAPSVMSVISRKSIDQFDFTSINNAVSNQPGFAINEDFGNLALNSRGIFENCYNNHTLLLIDGIPFNDFIFGTAYTSEATPMTFTKSIEVIRGPGSSLYGSNAMFGVVGIRTLSPDDMKGNYEIKFRGDFIHTSIIDLLTCGRTSKADFVIGYNYYKTDGIVANMYDFGYRKDSLGRLLKFPYNSKTESHYLFSKIEGKNDWKGFSFQIHLQYFEPPTGIGDMNLAPDQPQSLQEQVNTYILKYNTPSVTQKFQQQYVIAYKSHTINWNYRMEPVLDSLTSSVFNYVNHPYGVNEIIKTHADDIFTRLQWNYTTSNSSTILFGIENSIVIYNGDDLHLSNVNLSTEANNPNNALLEQGTWMPFIKNHPVFTTSFFGQYVSPKIINQKIQITSSLRYDNESFKFTPVDTPHIAGNEGSRTFQHFSPRFAIVYFPNNKLTLKAMMETSFRMPEPFELFCYKNTWTTTDFNPNQLSQTNVRNLQPEYLSTYELQGCWQIDKNISFKTNVFVEDFKNQIIYDNWYTNTLNFKDIGLESELNANYENLNVFLNYMYVKRIQVKLLNDTAEIKNNIPYTPNQTANLGISYQFKKMIFSVNSQYRGTTERKLGDQTDPYLGSLTPYRQDVIQPSIRSNIRFTYLFGKNSSASLTINNVFNNVSYYPFAWNSPSDWPMAGRTIKL